MNDRNKIIAGLLGFVMIVTFPFWFNFGKLSLAPELELTDKAKTARECVLPGDVMASEHMQLLDLWRHSVVRNAKRTFLNNNGIEYEMSLSNTCLDCHYNKVGFCDKCHSYASVEPYCWDCHIEDPKGDEK